MKNYALALYLLAILGAILFLTPPCKKSPPPSSPSEGGSGTLETVQRIEDRGLVFGRALTPFEISVAEQAALRPLSVERPSLQEAIKPVTNTIPKPASQWPKTYKAPDGVNTITENEDGTGSMTLIHVPRRITDSNGFNGHVITKAELDEVMTIIRDSANAHNFALDFYKTAVAWFKSPEEHAAIMANIRTVTESGKRLLEFEAKWRKRVEEVKP